MQFTLEQIEKAKEIFAQKGWSVDLKGWKLARTFLRDNESYQKHGDPTDLEVAVFNQIDWAQMVIESTLPNTQYKPVPSNGFDKPIADIFSALFLKNDECEPDYAYQAGLDENCSD